MRQKWIRFFGIGLCLGWSAIAVSCFADYEATVIRTYPGSERGRAEIALLVENVLSFLHISQLDGEPLWAKSQHTFPFRDDTKTQKYRDAAPDKLETIYIYELSPGDRTVTLTFSQGMAGVRAYRTNVALIFNAKAGHVYRLITKLINGMTALDYGIYDTTGETQFLVSEVVR